MKTFRTEDPNSGYYGMTAEQLAAFNPELEIIVRVDSGFVMFANMEEYETWGNQL